MKFWTFIFFSLISLQVSTMHGQDLNDPEYLGFYEDKEWWNKFGRPLNPNRYYDLNKNILCISWGEYSYRLDMGFTPPKPIEIPDDYQEIFLIKDLEYDVPSLKDLVIGKIIGSGIEYKPSILDGETKVIGAIRSTLEKIGLYNGNPPKINLPRALIEEIENIDPEKQTFKYYFCYRLPESNGLFSDGNEERFIDYNILHEIRFDPLTSLVSYRNRVMAIIQHRLEWGFRIFIKKS